MNRKKDTEGMDVLAPYVEAGRQMAPLPIEAERRLLKEARRGDTAARDELVRRFLPLVVAFSRKQAHGALPLEELIQEGNLGLLRAVEKYDPAAGTRFSTYSVWWIRAYVWRYLKTARSSVRPKSGTVAVTDLSLDRPLGDDDAEVTYLDRLEDDGPAPDARYAEAEGDGQLRGALDRVRGRIGELGWDIIHSRLKRDPPDTLQEIGKRWGVSRERVRQVEVATKRFLRGYLQPLEEERRAA